MKTFRLLAASLMALFIVLMPLPSFATNYEDLNDEQKKSVAVIVGALQADGYSDAAAAGVTANFYAESGFDPYVTNRSSGAWGLAQWHEERKDTIQTHLSGLGLPLQEPSDPAIRAEMLAAQAVYAVHEDAGPWHTGGNIFYYGLQNECQPFASMEDLKASDDPVRVACMFLTGWERPGAEEGRTSFHDKRGPLATSIYQALQAGTIEGVTPGQPGARQPAAPGTSAEGQDGALSDYALIGMPPQWVSVEGGDIVYADSTSLTVEEQVNVTTWGEANHLQEQINREHLVRSAVMFIGLLILGYGLILMFAGMLDVVTPGAQGMFTRVVTAGKYAYSPDADSKMSLGRKGRARYINGRILFLIVLLVLILGGLIISGAMGKWLLRLVYGIGGAF